MFNTTVSMTLVYRYYREEGSKSQELILACWEYFSIAGLICPRLNLFKTGPKSKRSKVLNLSKVSKSDHFGLLSKTDPKSQRASFYLPLVFKMNLDFSEPTYLFVFSNNTFSLSMLQEKRLLAWTLLHVFGKRNTK